jgi:hypothetical protein
MGHLDPSLVAGQELRKLLADKFVIVHHEDASIHGRPSLVVRRKIEAISKEAGLSRRLRENANG